MGNNAQGKVDNINLYRTNIPVDHHVHVSLPDDIFIDETTFRISVIFRVRSAKAVKITDMDLIKRLGAIVGMFILFLIVRTLVSPPRGAENSSIRHFLIL